jgi:hypothetical protein
LINAPNPYPPLHSFGGRVQLDLCQIQYIDEFPTAPALHYDLWPWHGETGPEDHFYATLGEKALKSKLETTGAYSIWDTIDIRGIAGFATPFDFSSG